MDQTTNSDFLNFDRPGDNESSDAGRAQPVDRPDSGGGGGEAMEAELPGVTQQTPTPADVPPGGDRPKGGSS